MQPVTKEKAMEQKKLINKRLKKMFGDRIKQNFLIEIKEKVLFQLGTSIEEYFDLSFDIDNAVSGIHDSAVDFEICRMIVGCHRANTIFLDESELAALQQDEKYKKKLIGQVIEEVKLRLCAGTFFRKEQVIPGDEFLFFPVLYKLFAMAVYAPTIMDYDDQKTEYYIDIFNRSLATMIMIESNFMDCAYPLLRGVIELFVKLMFADDDILLKLMATFKYWETVKTASGEYPSEFKEAYDQRINKSQKSMVDYLHYGWVDAIDDYHDKVKSKPYTFYGLLEYLKVTSDGDNANLYKLLETIFTRCHAFTHGNIGNDGYPLLHYFELTIGLYIAVASSYDHLCESVGCDSCINGIDILNTTEDDYHTLLEQYLKRSTENFEKYYKK